MNPKHSSRNSSSSHNILHIILSSLLLSLLFILIVTLYNKNSTPVELESFVSVTIDQAQPPGEQTTPDQTPKSQPDQNKTTSALEQNNTTPIIDKKVNYAQPKVFPNPLLYDQIIYPEIPQDTYIPFLQISWTLYGPDHLNIIITDAKNERYQMPYEDPYPHPRHPALSDPKMSNFEVEIETDPLNLIIKRKETHEIIFSLIDRLVFTDLYLEFTFKTPTNNIYGLGERFSPLQFTNGTYSLFILDRSGVVDRGQSGYNTNGHQSMYLMKEQQGLYHAFLFRNINAQELIIRDDNTITWKTIGGVLDFNFFLGDTPEMAVQRYHEYNGGWALPALWHLGSHQCKWWGYKNIRDLQYVLDEYDRVNLPLDVLWSDIDYFKESINFSYDESKFPPSAMRELYNTHKKRWIPVAQAYIPLQQESHAWTYPDVISLTVKNGEAPTEPSLGYEFSGHVYFIDFFHPDSESFWHKMLDYLNDKVPLSGIWLDANEVTNLINSSPSHYPGDRDRKYYKLPFYPGQTNLYELSVMELDSIHYGGVIEYNVRSVTSLLQSMYSYTYLRKKTYFPFVLTRGTMMGGARYAYHFLADLHSEWEFLKLSVAQLSTWNIFGFPFVGADICGMVGEVKTPPELCARWYQLAAFYPFARNHHAPENSRDNFQEPYRYAGDHFKAISDSILLRYSLLKQFYAFFFLKKQTDFGIGTVFRPVFFGFPQDPDLPPYGHRVHEEQFLLGDSIMVTPVLDEGTRSVDVYFPNCRWYDLRTYEEVAVLRPLTSISARLTELPPYFLRGGHIILKQSTEGVKSSGDLNNTFQIIVGLEELNETKLQKLSKATGYIMNASNSEEKYIYENCVIQNCMLRIEIDYTYNKGDYSTTMNLSVENFETGSTSDLIKVNELYVLGTAPETFQRVNGVTCQDCGSMKYFHLKKIDDILKITFGELDLQHGANYTFKFY